MYEYNDWIPVMASGTGGVAYLNAEDGALFDGSANQLQDTGFIYGSQGATRLDLVPLLAWEMLGRVSSRSLASKVVATVV